MAAAKDILITDDDLVFQNGDFAIIESDSQHIQDIIHESTGAYKQFPLVGVGIFNYLNGSNFGNGLKKEITSQLIIDGYSINQLDVDTEGNINVDAVRN